MIRRDDWRDQLLAYLAAQKGRQYDAKGFHCVHFAAGAVEAMTGADLMEPYRGDSQAASRRALKAAGLTDWVDVLEPLRIEAEAMRPGDVAVLRDSNRRMAAGICMGARLYVMGPHGLGTVPRASALWGARI